MGAAHRLRGRGPPALESHRAHLEKNGVEVIGVIDHSLFQSIHFCDPGGHRVELAWPNPAAAELMKRIERVELHMLEEWSRTKRAPPHASRHERGFQGC